MSHHHSDVLKPKEVVRILEHLGFQHEEALYFNQAKIDKFSENKLQKGLKLANF